MPKSNAQRQADYRERRKAGVPIQSKHDPTRRGKVRLEPSDSDEFPDFDEWCAGIGMPTTPDEASLQLRLLDIYERRGQLVPRHELTKAAREFAVKVKTEFDALPAAIKSACPDLDDTVMAAIRDKIAEAARRISR